MIFNKSDVFGLSQLSQISCDLGCGSKNTSPNSENIKQNAESKLIFHQVLFLRLVIQYVHTLVLKNNYLLMTSEILFRLILIFLR